MIPMKCRSVSILIGVVLWADSFNLNEIVKQDMAGLVNAFGSLLFPLAVMFLISSLAETAQQRLT